MSELSRSVLITGANGFVGTRLCQKFLNEGFKVIAGVRKTADLSSLSDLDVEFRYGDVTKPETLPEMVSGVDYIVHNAGLVKAKKKQSFFDVNHLGVASLFEAISKSNPTVKKVVHISSLAAAGRSGTSGPLIETDEPKPLTIYGQSKLAGERVALSYKDRLPVVVVRPPGIYGPGDREIFTFFETVNNRIKPYIGNSDRLIQLVHVDDLCRGLVLATTANVESGSIYFICEKRAYSIRELIALLEKGAGKKAFPLVIPSPLFRLIAFMSEWSLRIVGATPMLTSEKANELLESWEMNVDKAKQELGFESKIEFELGAKETYQWYRENGWLK